MSLSGKVAIVTGASRGIGRSIALRLARDGAAVVVNYAGNAAAAKEAVAEITAAGGRAIAVQADVGKLADIGRLLETAIAQFGKLDILVNNAGVFFTKPLSEVTEQEFDRIFEVNVKGTYFACQQAPRTDGGRWPDHQLLVFDDGHDAAALFGLCSHEGSGRTVVARVGQRSRFARNHRQRCLTGANRYRSVRLG